MSSNAIAISAQQITKTYGATVALDGASLTVQAGTVHALLGENGAGKSTMVKILSGLVCPDSGNIQMFGETCSIDTPRIAQRLGLQTAFQEMTQIRDLTVAQNLLLPLEPRTRIGIVDTKLSLSIARDHLESLGLGSIDPGAMIGDLELSVRQKLEIARAIYRQPRVLLLDEPTSTLSGRDIDWLGGVIDTVKQRGTAVIFISHRMPEVNAFCEFLTVFRNGKDVGTSRIGELPQDEIVRLIIGRSLIATFPHRSTLDNENKVPALAAKNLSVSGHLESASFEISTGEILGISGLQGMGQSELFLACFGATPLDNGYIEVNGKRIDLMSPRDAVRQNVGIGLIPEDRKTEGLFLKLDGLQNLSLPVLSRYTSFGILDKKAEATAVQEVIETVQVDFRAMFTRAGAFSGGNQQKLVFGKWLLTGSRVLLMYDPTRGVDVGTKHELYLLMHEFTKAGGSILLFSTEIPELVNLCHRVLVMYGGKIVVELNEDQLDEERIIRAALGETSDKLFKKAHQ